MLRQLQLIVPPKVSFTPDHDSLFLYDRIPVRLRYNAVPPGQVVVVAHSDVPPRKCCDEAVMTTIMLALNKGNA